MSVFITLLMLTFILILLAVLGLAIGWFLTGKVIKKGSCGYDPTKKKGDCEQNKGCSVCGKK